MNYSEKYNNIDLSQYDLDHDYEIPEMYNDVGDGQITGYGNIDLEECLKIHNAAQKFLNIELGLVKCANLWYIRSNAYDATFLIVPDNPRQIVIDLIEFTNALKMG